MCLMKKQNRTAVLVVLIAGMLLSCRSAPERRFELKGKVVSVDRAQRQVVIAHEQIPGFMDAMTMPFDVHDDWAISVLEPGQKIEATLVVRDDRSWIEGLRISKTEQIKGAAAAGSEPKIGEAVPDFSLLNQDNRPIHLSQYHGRSVLLTFIYTRCPLPDYCPRTSRNFSEIHQALQSGKKSGDIPHLLTVSFDTEHDTPAVLKEYARRYMNPPAFGEWEFATGSPEEIKKITSYFGLTYWPEAGQITHNLVTTLIGPDGKLLRLYQGNQWKPAQVLADLRF
jgi:protein SCO1